MEEVARSEQESIYPGLASDLVCYLQNQGYTLRGIGELVGLSESFVSRVRRKQRTFTLDHLVRLEKAIGKALPIILLEATNPSSVPDELRPIYLAFRNMFRGSRVAKTADPGRRRKGE